MDGGRKKRKRVELFLLVVASEMSFEPHQSCKRHANAPDREPASQGKARLTLFVVFLLLAILSGCAKKKPRVPVVSAPVIGTIEAGIASWYGNPYHGRYAANGEVYDMEKLTAAHRTLPFGTWVRVHNTVNGKSVTVRINDRGPFIDGRIIDLSHAAARSIEMIGPGIVKVRVEVIARPAEYEGELYAVQVGLFRNETSARKLCDRMQHDYNVAQSIRRDGSPPAWRVLVGREANYYDAASLAARIRKAHGPVFVVRLDEPVR